MKLAPDSHLKFEAFFREFFADEQFQVPEVYFYSGKFSRLLTETLKIHGIAIGKNVFVTPKFVSVENKRLKIHTELAAHEIVHVLQYKREGFIKFLYEYLKSYRRNLKKKKILDKVSRRQAYWEIPFEIEAREIAAKFVEWNEKNGKRIMDNG
ncbi:MAG TPA: hypothetical protein VNI84_12770 [Pyrinomonadaceae bacterium]|nr:hypothetical protein [Pyrinomonadaceae bacterium]